MTLEQLREEILTLPIEDRACLARDLILSLGDADAEGVLSELPPVWMDEIVARSDAVRRGECDGDDWRMSLERVEQLLAARKSS